MWRRWIYALRARLRALVRPERSDRELDDELSFHLDMETQDNMSHGMSRTEAKRRARLELGGVQQLKESLHDQRSVQWFDHLRQDVRYAGRTIWRTKVASLAVIATFALGIGANAAIYMPYLQHPGPGSRLTLLTQTSLDPSSLTESIRETARRLNPGVPIRFSTMDDVFEQALAYPRFRTTLVAAFALLAGLLALVGIYSVLSYLVAEQTPEIGVRLAMGALRRDIFSRVIGGSMRLVLVGVVVGLVIALAAVRTIQAMLFDISARDPLTIAAVVGLLMLTALAASGIPALRAASVDPLVALRDE